jgi:segregation and condensation protein A
MTISQIEAQELPATVGAGAVSRQAAERVLNYLVFHRSLHGETDGQSPLLERYMTLVQELKEGVHVVIADPFDKALAMLFELVLDESFDPWEIDLGRFTELYLKRIRDDGGVDFAVAGRLVFMAWSILWLQSREILASREPPPEAQGDGLSAPTDGGFLDELTTPEAVDVTAAVLEAPEPPRLEFMVRHHEARPVSLLELVSAFGEAELEARRALRVEELRARLREEQRSPPEILVHGEVPERDVADLWEIALAHPIGEPFPLLSAWRPEQGRDRLVGTFLAALHLSRVQAIDLRQAKIAESPLLVVRATAERPELAPES